MNLYILRHGKAEPLGPAYPRDDERPLSPGGWRRTERSAKGMASANVAVGAIISSPLLRAPPNRRDRSPGTRRRRGDRIFRRPCHR